MARNPGRLARGWRGTGKSGNIFRSVLGGAIAGGGAEVTPIAPGDVPYNDPTFDANTQLRFKPANPVRNFISGNQGGNIANQLNTEQAVNDQSRLNQKADTIEMSKLEDQLNREFAEFQEGLKVKANDRQDAALGQAFRSLKITNPEMLNGINIPPELSDIHVGNMLRHALGGAIGKEGLIAGLPASRAAAATSANTEAQATAAQPMVGDISKAVEMFKRNQANEELKASQSDQFGPAVASSVINKLRMPQVANMSNNRFSVSPGQTVVEPDIVNPTSQPTLYKGPEILTKMVESPPTQVGDVTIPGKPIREQEVVSPFQIQRPIKIANPNPNPTGSSLTNPVSNPSVIDMLRRKSYRGVGASGGW